MASPSQCILLFVLIPLALIPAFSPKLSSAQPKPLCLTQFSLANQACSTLPSTAVKSQVVSTRDRLHDDDDDDDHDHHKHDHMPRAFKDCCRWLEEVEHECVCDALLKLPPFLIKHRHKYTVKVEEACTFNYKCDGV